MLSRSKVEGWAYRIFGGVASRFLGNVFEFRDKLKLGRIKIYPETYVSLMFFTAFLTIPVTITAMILLYYFQWTPLVLFVPTPIIVMIMFLIVPSMKAGERATSLEREMPFAAAYVTVMATGGISPYTSVNRLSSVGLMPAMRKEAKEVIKDVEIFGTDPLSALDRAAKSNPLDTFSDFFSGYASTVITGGDIPHYLEVKTQDIFKTRSLRIKVAAERLGTLLESFIIIMVLMSLCFYILFSVESIYSTGMGLNSGMLLYSYVFAPLLSVVFIYLAHDMQPKTPITDWKPYKYFAVSSLIGVLVLLCLSDFFGIIQVPYLKALSGVVDLPIAVALSLVITTAIPAVIQIKNTKKRSSMEKGIATFLRDLTEVRKTGMSPEKCIESLSKRRYGAFSKELRTIASQLSWGVPLKRVFTDFIAKTKSWLSQIIVFLLVETVDVGGGSIGMIESLARFSKMTQDVEKEKKMSVRPYIIIPYFAAVLLTATTLMVLIFVTKTVSIAGTMNIDLKGITTAFTISVIFHVYMIGLVAGKISEESISAGFKHAALLVIISTVASVLVPQLVTL